jgi:EXLDI family protein
MGNKTIYVSENDELLYEKAKEIAGEALSSVIARALREFVSRHQEKEKGMKEISLKVGKEKAEREMRFVGTKLGEWTGFSDDKEWWLKGTIYKTQKGNFAIYLITVCKASLLTNPGHWKMSGDYLVNSKSSDLIVGKNSKELEDKLPKELLVSLENYLKKDEQPIEYLDI